MVAQVFMLDRAVFFLLTFAAWFSGANGKPTIYGPLLSARSLGSDASSGGSGGSIEALVDPTGKAEISRSAPNGTNYTPTSYNSGSNSSRFARAVHEPLDGQVYVGAWYDSSTGETALSLNSRIGYRPLAMFQLDMTIGETFDVEELKMYAMQLDDTQTDAILYLTLYPHKGMDTVSDQALTLLVDSLRKIRKAGRRIMIRYAPEMNGNWFIYGQKPGLFVYEWRRLVGFLRSRIDQIAFIWAPYAGIGYPYPQTPYSVQSGTVDFETLDTNSDRIVDSADDPYTPYWPGDSFVDWVGVSMYAQGGRSPRSQNIVPGPNQAERILRGSLSNNSTGNYSIYAMFSGLSSSPRKPMMIAETGAGYNPAATGASNLEMKQRWWRQFMNDTFLSAYPKIKAVCFSEYVSQDNVDFRSMSLKDSVVDAFRQDIQTVRSALYAAPFTIDVGSLFESGATITMTTPALLLGLVSLAVIVL